jgi:hypothetical protein
MTRKRFSLAVNTLFDGRTENIALVYDEHGGHQGNIVTDNGNIEYVNEHHIYEQVEFFNDIDSLKKREEVLKKISNKTYKNFRIHYK